MVEKSLDERTDEELVALAQAGDKEAEEAILSRYGGLVRYFARKFFLKDKETEDFAIEGTWGLYQAIEKYKSDMGSFKSFATKCIARRITDFYKTEKRTKKVPAEICVPYTDEELFDGDSNPEQTLIYNEEEKRLNKIMSRVLTDFEFKVFVMFLNGEKISEICEATGKNYKSVDNAIQRSKQKLKKALTEEK